MPPDITGVIATVFEPPQLQRLLWDLEHAGAQAVVVKRQRTNPAWNAGLAQVKTRYAVVLNDDIEVNAGWVERLVRHHEAGYTHVAASLWREVKNLRVEPGARSLAEAYHKGHLFSMDQKVEVPPVPDDLSIYFGDDWFYWHHRYKGRCCMALDVQLKTGWDLGRDHMSGYTCHHPDAEAFLGEPLFDIARRDFVAAKRYFAFPADTRREEEKQFAEATKPAVGLLVA